jgi:hypothetical protein
MQDLRPPSTHDVDMIRAAQWSLRGWPYKRSVPAGIGLRQLCSFDTFTAAMTVSLGIKAPLNYSVFVDAAAALLVAAVLESGELKLK